MPASNVCLEGHHKLCTGYAAKDEFCTCSCHDITHSEPLPPPPSSFDMPMPLIVREPTLYLLSYQMINEPDLDRYLADKGVEWIHDLPTGAGRDGENIAEIGGRICYGAFGTKQFRRTNASYLANILESKHGSVTEHAVWVFIVTGVSRSFSHELIRHRAGTAVSQLSQRYVDESEARYVQPPTIKEGTSAYVAWYAAIRRAHHEYKTLVDLLAQQISEDHGKTLTRVEQRKMAREAARSVLPNATETELVWTANARALRHIIELRGSSGAEPEIRRFAVKLAKIMRELAPNLFYDVETELLPNGTVGTTVEHSKV